jgi:glycolate oxidase FAD binding subunit
MLGLGLPPTRPGVAVDLRALNQVIDYPARDMTITVQAGITIAKLQELLAAENQWLPIDVPQADRATLGGALATNTSGTRRHGYGTLRDFVLGISVINDDGHEIKAGGRVVKNVAGYDLMKLYVGSLGTLGIITQVTLKVKPRPEAQALMTLGCRGPVVGPLLDILHRSRTRPVCLELLSAAAAKEIGTASGGRLPQLPWVVVAGFEDNREAANWQVRQLSGEVPAGEGIAMDVLAEGATGPLWPALTDFPAWPGARLTFKANLLPSATADFCQQAADLPTAPLIQAHAGNGIVLGHVAGGPEVRRDREGTAALLQVAETVPPLLRLLAPAAGNLTFPRCPVAWKKALPVWGVPRGDWTLMRRVKEAFDPRGLFNPGRFLDGIWTEH